MNKDDFVFNKTKVNVYGKICKKVLAVRLQMPFPIYFVICCVFQGSTGDDKYIFDIDMFNI